MSRDRRQVGATKDIKIGAIGRVLTIVSSIPIITTIVSFLLVNLTTMSVINRHGAVGVTVSIRNFPRVVECVAIRGEKHGWMDISPSSGVNRHFDGVYGVAESGFCGRYGIGRSDRWFC